MPYKMQTGLTAFVTLLFFNVVNAQQPPQPPKALTDLLRFEGKWEGPATFTMEGKTHQFTYYADFRRTADGSGLYMDEWFDAPGLGAMKGANLIGYNANDGKIHWFSVDNFGTTHDHLGVWKAPDHFFMQARETQGGKKFVENIEVTLTRPDTMDLLITATLDGKETLRCVATFHHSGQGVGAR